MNHFLDTYCAMSGEKRLFGIHTFVNCPDAVARNLLEPLKSSTTQIQSVCFTPISDSAIQMVNGTFGNVYEDAADSYIIAVTDTKIQVFFSTENSIRYAACAIVRHYDCGIPTGLLYNVPLCPFRAMKVYIPPMDQIAYFKEFIDMCMYYGYNTLLLEIGGAMEYKRHPEINEGWVEYCGIFREYQGKSIDVQNSMPWHKNSIHWENGGGSYLTQETLKDISEYCRARGIAIIPEVPSLSHCDYMLTRHPELAENPADPLADTYCPSNPGSYTLLFDLLDEIVELFQPDTVHIGHDEWYTFCLCDRCKGRDPAELYAADIQKIMDYLKAKGVDTMIWGEKLLNAVTKEGGRFGGAHRKEVKAPIKGKTVNIYGKEYPVYSSNSDPEVVDLSRQVTIEVPPTYHSIDLVPKNLKIMHWYHSVADGFDDEYHKRGLWCVFGNFGSSIKHFYNRIEKGIHGVAISNWGMIEQRYLQRNFILNEMVSSAHLLWNRTFDRTKQTEHLLAVAKELFTYHYRFLITKSHIEIIHTANVIIPQIYFGFFDGVLMDDDKERLGYYHIQYQDGSRETVDILLGSNIGYTPNNWDGSQEQLDSFFAIPERVLRADGLPEESNSFRPQLLEALYTCDFVFKNNKIYYKLLLPTKKEVASVTPEIFDKYKHSVYIDSIQIY